MKLSWKKIVVTSAAAAVIVVGCTSAPSRQVGVRYPAMSKSKPSNQDNGDGNNGGGTVVVDPSSQVVRISSINGVYDTSHGGSVDIHPGDVIQLSADVFTASDAGFQPENQVVENFVWSADDSSSDQCDASTSGDCLVNSNFQVTDYGVNFYVPANVGQQITISVNNSQIAGAGNDVLVLNNADYAPDYVAPAVIVSSVDQYPCSTFNPDCALAGQGHFIYIDGARYFVPYVTDAGWVPYSHGYWTWVDPSPQDSGGWTWVSYDTWGWYTDHYGAWRHHGVYGWIWSPYDDGAYRAGAVTWFYDGSHVGWYPYYDGYRDRNGLNGYAWGDEHGFDDGYWAGYQNADFYANYHPGWNAIGYHDWSNQDMYSVRMGDSDCGNTFRGSFNNHSYGGFPGGADLNSSHTYMQGHVDTIVVTQVNVHTYGGIQVRGPVGTHPVPAQYQNVPAASQRFNGKPIPVGSVVSTKNGQDHIEPPTSNGRGITAPPHVIDAQTGKSVAVPPNTNHPAQPNSGNGNFHPPTPPAQAPHLPVYNPPANNGGNNHPPVVNPPNHGGNPPVVNPPKPKPQPPKPKPQPQPPHNNSGNGGGNAGGNHNTPAPAPKPKPQPPEEPAQGSDDDNHGDGNEGGGGEEKPAPEKPAPEKPAPGKR